MKQEQSASLMRSGTKVREMAVLLSAIGTVSRRLAEKLVLLEKRLAEKEGETHEQA